LHDKTVMICVYRQILFIYLFKAERRPEDVLASVRSPAPDTAVEGRGGQGSVPCQPPVGAVPTRTSPNSTAARLLTLISSA